MINRRQVTGNQLEHRYMTVVSVNSYKLPRQSVKQQEFLDLQILKPIFNSLTW